MTEDSELVRRFKAGDETGFDELVRKYQSRIHGLLFRLVRNSEDASDLAQEVFVRAFRALPGFEGKSAFYTWLYRITVNTGLNHLRSRRRTLEHRAGELQPDVDTLAELPDRSTPQADWQQTRLRAAISAAVAELPERQRAVFVMRQYDDLSNEEISRVLHCAVGTVKAHYHFAMQRLQARLQKWHRSPAAPELAPVREEAGHELP
jgi:RNA polymerase sigma-70 factor (ECF subfamily)